VAILVLSLGLLGRTGGGAAATPLTLFCAAGLRQPVEQIVADYERELGVPVRVQYGGSNSLLSQVEAGGVGDLLLVAEEFYVDQARQKGLAREAIPVAQQRPVIAVRQGNPRQVAGLADLLRADVRVALANPEQAAIGRLTRQLLEPAGRWTDLERAVRQRGVFKPTVADLANDLKLGTVDASILWDAMVRQDPDLEAVTSAELGQGRARCMICVLASAKDPASALRFARYVTARDRGLAAFAAAGYEVAEGDLWAETPQLTFFVGLVARRALEETIQEFEQREGVRVNTVYNGCGILTAQMLASRNRRAGGFPDLYLAGDVCFLEPVRNDFQEALEISETQIALVVEKENPKGIQGLQDLTRAGVRVVMGHPQQCTIGVLTQRLLQEEGLGEQVTDRVVSQLATSAMLIPAVTTGAADVALAWNTDALAESGRLDAIRIDSPHTRGIQPLAIARASDHQELARRLVAAIARSQARFEAAGFGWRLARPASHLESGGRP
jgi:molybdenum ABC transporter molybdate-binding protein